MSGISERGEFADYRAIGSGVAIMPSVSVVIPAKNEARNLEHVFNTIPAWVDEIVLVDGKSTDDTVAVAQKLYPEIRVVHQEGRGKGDALQAGFAAAKGDIIVMMDADGSTDGREIPRFVAALVTGADFAKGSRFASGGGTEDITGSRCSPYTFQWSANAYTALRATLDYVSKTMPDKKKIYTITADYAFGQSLLRYAQVAAKELGLELVGNDNHPSGERQFTQYFTKALSTRPDLICLLTAGADAVSAVRQFHSFGVKTVQLVGPWTLEIEQMQELSPAMLNGMILGLNYTRTSIRR